MTAWVSIENDAEFIRLSQAPDAVHWAMSLTGEITRVSDSVREVRGYSPQEAMAQGGDEIHPPQSLTESLRYFEELGRTLQAGQPPAPFHGSLEYRCADGSTVWCDVAAGIVVTPTGDITEFRGVSVPVTPPESPAVA